MCAHAQLVSSLSLGALELKGRTCLFTMGSRDLVKKLSIKELCNYLESKGLDSTYTEQLKNNDIDGEALLLLIEDMEEFSIIFPKALARLKIKKAIGNYNSKV